MQKIIWIIGSPRSGTSFLTDYIGNYTDYCFNEPWGDFSLGKHKDWKLPTEGDFVFKYCANALYYDEISKLYPKSKWVCIVRDPFHVIYSMFYPKKGSRPKKLWEYMGDEPNERICQVFSKWHSIFSASIKIKEIKLVKYENIDIESLADFLKLPLSRDNFNYSNRNEVYSTEKMKFLIEFLKNNSLYDDVVKAKNLVENHRKLYF